MKQIFNIIALQLVCLVFANSAWAKPTIEHSYQAFQQEFVLGASQELDIQSRDGDIYIFPNPNSESTVTVKVKVTIEAEEESEIQAMMQLIRIEEELTPTAVKIRTKLPSIRTMKCNNSKCKIKFETGDRIILDSYSIDYMIYAPVTTPFKINHKYGDIEIDEILANMNIELRYGELKGHKIAGDLQLQMKYSDLLVDEIKSLSGGIRYSDVFAKKIDFVNLSDFDYSDMEVDKIDSLRLTDMRYSDVILEELAHGEVTCSYSDLDVSHLKYYLNTDNRYSNVKIREVSSSLKTLEFEGAYSDLSANLKGLDDYCGKAELTYGSFISDDPWKKVSDNSHGSSSKAYAREGKAETNCVLSVFSRYGDIKIR